MMLETGKAYVTPVIPGGRVVAQIILARKYVQLWDITLTVAADSDGRLEIVAVARAEYVDREYTEPAHHWSIETTLTRLAAKVEEGEATIPEAEPAAKSDGDSDEETEDAF